jgi:hypothetical protein
VSRSCDPTLLPPITWANNPYAIPEVSVDVAPGPPRSHTLRTPATPSQERRGVAEEFFELHPLTAVLRFTTRQNMDQSTTNSHSILRRNPCSTKRKRSSGRRCEVLRMGMACRLDLKVRRQRHPLPRSHGAPSSSDQLPEVGSWTQREPTPRYAPDQ